MLFTVHWNVNDGRFGYPNIVADLSWSESDCGSYKKAIANHAKIKDVNKLLSVSPIIGGQGVINGRNYRDFKVDYVHKGVTETKEFYLAGEVVSKVVRVFGSYRKSK